MRTFVTLLIATLIPPALLADEAYRWVDEDGIVQISQWKPEKTTGVTRLRVNRQASRDYDPLTDPYSIRNQAERMRETWKKTEERRAERRQERKEAAERAARQKPTYYYPYYPYYPTYPTYDFPPTVRPPVVRPPIQQPLHRPLRAGYRQKLQRGQINGLRKYNAQPHLRVPYSAVTGVSQRATIHRSPTVSPLSGYRTR